MRASTLGWSSAFEPQERFAIADGKVADRVTVTRAEALAEGRLYLRVVVELVDDVVAGDGRRAVPRKSGQRLALPRSDAAGDRDGEQA